MTRRTRTVELLRVMGFQLASPLEFARFMDTYPAGVWHQMSRGYPMRICTDDLNGPIIAVSLPEPAMDFIRVYS